MATRTVQLTVAKCEEEELDNVRTYLQNLEQVLKENDCYDEDDSEVNKEIADVARKFRRESQRTTQTRAYAAAHQSHHC